jgi:hypothetical protein
LTLNLLKAGSKTGSNVNNDVFIARQLIYPVRTMLCSGRCSVQYLAVLCLSDRNDAPDCPFLFFHAYAGFIQRSKNSIKADKGTRPQLISHPDKYCPSGTSIDRNAIALGAA